MAIDGVALTGDPAHVDWHLYSEFPVVIAPGVPQGARKAILAYHTGTPRQRRRAATHAEPFATRVLAPDRLDRLRNVPDMARQAYTVHVLAERLLASAALQDGWLEDVIDGFAVEAARWRLLTLLCEQHEQVHMRGAAGNPILPAYVETQVAALRLLVRSVYAIDTARELGGGDVARPVITGPMTTDLSVAAERALTLARHLHAAVVGR